MPALTTGWGDGFTMSTGDSTAGVWNDVITFSSDTTASSITFDSLRDQVWTQWTCPANTMTGDATDHIWRVWTDNRSSTTFTIRDVVWENWTSGDVTHTPLRRRRTADYYQIPAPPAPPTPLEQLKQRLKSISQRRKAKSRGLELLRSLVSAEQWQDYRRYGSVREVGQHAIYEIGCGWMGHVYELNFNGEPKRKLCLQMGIGQHGKQWTKGDRIAAVLLALRNDELGTVAKAGVHRWGEYEQQRVRARRGHLVVVAS